MKLNEEDLLALKEAGYTDNEIDLFIKDSLDDLRTESEMCYECSLGKCNNEYKLSNLVNIDKFELVKDIKFYSILSNNKRIVFTTPKLYLPFGIDKYYNNWSVHFEIKENSCKGYKEFIDYLKNIEKFIIDSLKIQETMLSSQLKTSNKFNLDFYGRIQSRNNKPSCSLLDDRNKISKYLNIFNFPKEVNVIAKIRIGNIWLIKGIYYYKLNITELKIIN